MEESIRLYCGGTTRWIVTHSLDRSPPRISVIEPGLDGVEKKMSSTASSPQVHIPLFTYWNNFQKGVGGVNPIPLVNFV